MDWADIAAGQYRKHGATGQQLKAVLNIEITDPETLRIIKAARAKTSTPASVYMKSTYEDETHRDVFLALMGAPITSRVIKLLKEFPQSVLNARPNGPAQSLLTIKSIVTHISTDPYTMAEDVQLGYTFEPLPTVVPTSQ